MPTITTLLTFAAASFGLLVIPGPAVLFIVNRSVADGRRVGLASVAGIELGTLVHVAAAAVGLSAALAASATLFDAVKWIGAGYLVVIGLRTLITRPVKMSDDLGAVTIAPRRAFRQGIVVNVFNPKVALFFLSFLPQFIDPTRGRAGLQALALGLVFVSIGTLTDGLYAMAASALRHVLVGGRTLPFVQRYVAGTVFVLLGVLAGTHRRVVTPGS
ncbi:MAG: LysE family translocator [Ilumatobacteraceae bacterium]